MNKKRQKVCAQCLKRFEKNNWGYLDEKRNSIRIDFFFDGVGGWGRDSLMVTSNAGSAGSISGWGTKIPHAAWRGRKQIKQTKE